MRAGTERKIVRARRGPAGLFYVKTGKWNGNQQELLHLQVTAIFFVTFLIVI